MWDNKPGSLNGKMFRNYQELPSGEAAERSEAEEGRRRQLLYAHSAANPYSVPFRLGYLNESLRPAALFRPGKPGHLPPREGLGGDFSPVPFNQAYTLFGCTPPLISHARWACQLVNSGIIATGNDCYLRFAVRRTAPGGSQGGASNIIVTTAKTSPDGAGKLLDSYSPKGVTKKPVTNVKTVTGFFANLGGSGRLLAGHARERFHLGIQ